MACIYYLAEVKNHETYIHDPPRALKSPDASDYGFGCCGSHASMTNPMLFCAINTLVRSWSSTVSMFPRRVWIGFSATKKTICSLSTLHCIRLELSHSHSHGLSYYVLESAIDIERTSRISKAVCYLLVDTMIRDVSGTPTSDVLCSNIAGFESLLQRHQALEPVSVDVFATGAEIDTDGEVEIFRGSRLRTFCPQHRCTRYYEKWLAESNSAVVNIGRV
ncbi:hypothetical protein F5146DRAFT_1006931 [Armillaria mellea]|nr:hypothetical protein F5146DRAFT_1006931 [Armillaria mellea]